MQIQFGTPAGRESYDACTEHIPIRLRYFLDYNFGTAVVTVNFQDWAKTVRRNGAVTRLEEVPEKPSGVRKDAEVVVAVASGIANPSPGIDIVRKDQGNAPFVYNTDHYTAVAKLTGHPKYFSFVRRAGVQNSDELRRAIDSWVWIIGPSRDPAVHWSKEIPEYIGAAKEKTGQERGADPPTPAAP